MRTTTLLTGLCAAASALAAQLTLHLPPSPPLLPNPSTLPASTQAHLLGPDGQLLTARLTRHNTLAFPSVPEGSHLLTLHSRDLVFAPLRVDVTPVGGISAAQTFRGNEWGHKGAVLGTNDNGTLALEVRPTARKDFYAQRPGFNVMSVFKNPMILMALVSGALIFGMPYLIDNMDEETKAEWDEQQKKGLLGGAGGGDATSAIQNFDFAGWMAGSSKTSQPAPPKVEGQRSLR